MSNVRLRQKAKERYLLPLLVQICSIFTCRALQEVFEGVKYGLHEIDPSIPRAIVDESYKVLGVSH